MGFTRRCTDLSFDKPNRFSGLVPCSDGWMAPVASASVGSQHDVESNVRGAPSLPKVPWLYNGRGLSVFLPRARAHSPSKRHSACDGKMRRDFTGIKVPLWNVVYTQTELCVVRCFDFR